MIYLVNLSIFLKGWSGSADPRRRAMEIKHIEAEDMKREMDEVQQRKYAEYDDLRSNVINTYTALIPCSSDKTNPIIQQMNRALKISRIFSNSSNTEISGWC